MNQDQRIKMLLEYLQDDPDDPFSRYALALEYMKSEAFEEAEKLFHSVHQKSPGYLANYYHYGRLLISLSRPVEAARIIEQGMAVAQEQNDLHTLNELKSLEDEAM